MKNKKVIIALKKNEDIEFISNIMLLNGCNIIYTVKSSKDLVKFTLRTPPDLIICSKDLEDKNSGTNALMEIEQLLPVCFIIIAEPGQLPEDSGIPENNPSVWLSTPIESEELTINVRLLLNNNSDRLKYMKTERLYGLISEINDFIFSADENGVIIDADNYLLRRIGFDRNELVGRKFTDIVYMPDRKMLSDTFFEGIKKGRKIFKGLQFRIMMPDSSIKWFEMSGIILHNPERGFLRGEGILRDIDELKKTEISLRENEARYRALVNSQMEAVCRWLPDMTLTFVNLAYCSFFGKSESELLGTRWLELVPEKSRKKVEEFYTGMIFNPRVFRYEHEVTSADGSIRWQEWVDSPIFDEKGNLMEFQSVGRDITERRNLEETLRKLLKEKDEVIERINERKKSRSDN